MLLQLRTRLHCRTHFMYTRRTLILPACTRNVRPTHNLSHTDSAETDCTACMADAGVK